MKTYYSEGAHRVWVRPEGAQFYPLMHYARHSPTGFSWGYHGSGPADLARCILIDHLELHALADKGENLWLVDRLYQAFKVDVIAEFPFGGQWELTSDKVQAWINMHDGHRTAT